MEKNCKNVEDIISLFTEVLKHPEKCCDFDLVRYLTRYEELQSYSNFIEAALVVGSSGPIYGRKVDFLTDLVLDLKRESMSNERADNLKPQKQRKKKKTAIDDDVWVKEYNDKPLKIIPIAELTAGASDARNEALDHLNGAYPPFYTIKKNTKLKYPIVDAKRAKHNIDNMVFGKIPIIDKDGYVDSRANYRVFMSYIDHNHNTTDGPIYQHRERIIQEKESRKSNKPFNLYIPASYLKNTYDIDLTHNEEYLNMQKYQRVVQQCVAKDMQELFRNTNGAYLNSILTGGTDVSLHCLAENETTSNTTDEPMHDDSNPIDTTTTQTSLLNSSSCSITDGQNISNVSLFNCDLSAINNNNSTIVEDASDNVSAATDSTPQQPINTTTDDWNSIAQHAGDNDGITGATTLTKGNIRDSMDEGIGSLINSPWSCMSEMDPLDRSSLSPKVELFDVLEALNVGPDDVKEFTYTVSPEMSTENRRHMEQITQQTCIRMSTTFKALDDLNIVDCLKLPKALLQGTSIFTLPPEYRTAMMKKRKQSPPLSSKQKAIRFNDDDVCSIGSEFLGFDDQHEVERLALARQDSGLDVGTSEDDAFACNSPNTIHQNVIAATIDSPDQIERLDKSCDRSQFADSGFADDDNLTFSTALDDSMAVVTTKRPSDILVADDCLPHELTPSALNEMHARRLKTQTELREMTERVKQWHETLRPVIQQSERRNHFDIHAFGRKIVSVVQNNRNDAAVTFDDVIRDQDKSHTANYFLSMLQLVNNRSVDITVEKGDDTADAFTATSYKKIKITLCPFV